MLLPLGIGIPLGIGSALALERDVLDPGGNAALPSNPGEGGPVCPGGTICGGMNRDAARVRFLNAAYGYPALRVLVGGAPFVNRLQYASVSCYGRIQTGYRAIRIAGTDGCVYLQKTLLFQPDTATTAAIIHSAAGMDILQIADGGCPPVNGYIPKRPPSGGRLGYIWKKSR